MCEQNHHDKFHKEELGRLERLLDSYFETGYVPEADRVIVEELKAHYKNSNKGIKGRGKGVKVAKINRSPKVASGPRYPTKYSEDNTRGSQATYSNHAVPLYHTQPQPFHHGTIYRPAVPLQVPSYHGRY
jgi:hypothetical protein